MERVDGTSEAFKNSQGKSYETDQEYEARRNAAKQRLAEKNPKKYGTGINSAADADANLKTLIQKGESGLKQDIVDAMAKGDKEGEYSYLFTECGNTWYSTTKNPMYRDNCICPKCRKKIVSDNAKKRNLSKLGVEARRKRSEQNAR